VEQWKIVAASLVASVGVAMIIASGLLFPIYSSQPKNPCGESASSFVSERLIASSPTPSELFDTADLVVVGRITDSTLRCDGPQIMTYMQVEIEESLKNPENIRTLTTKTIWMEDTPIFSNGDRVFLYLRQERADGNMYWINPFSFALAADGSPDNSVSGRELLQTFRLRSAAMDASPLELQQGTGKDAIVTLESYFGYDSPTNLTFSSFGRYDKQGVFNSANITVLNENGIFIEPSFAVITPPANGTTQAKFLIRASENAVASVYDIHISSVDEGRYASLAGGVADAYIRINVTDSAASPYNDAMSINIEKHGTRDFYQDQKIFLPTNFTLSDAAVFEPRTTVGWPSIGPNFVIETADTNVVIFDYYKSLGIDTNNFPEIEYDEYFRTEELSPPPAISGRYFGFEWNQTTKEGIRAGPGSYSAYLSMPVKITQGSGNNIFVMLTSEPESFRILEGEADDLKHDLSLTLNVSKEELATGELFSFTLILINNSDHPEHFSLDRGGIGFFSPNRQWPTAVSEPCYFALANGIEDYDQWQMSMYANYFMGEESLMVGAHLVIHENVVIEAPKYPGIYYLNGSETLTIADEGIEGKSEFDSVRVSCLDVDVLEPIILNVTAPVYEGVNLILSTDKAVYEQNETVSFDLYIENDSDYPFKLSEQEPILHIRDAASGKEIAAITFVADFHQYPVVQPHSKFKVSSAFPLVWDQKVYDGKSEQRLVETGHYLVKATFTFPYLESEELSIIISE